MRAKAAFHVRNKSMQADDAAVHEAVQARSRVLVLPPRLCAGAVA